MFSTLTFVSGFAKSLLTRQPKEPIIAAARAGGNPSDAVVAVDAKGVHLGPVLTRVLEGSHCFFIHTLPAGQLAATLSLNWDRVLDAEGITSAPGLSSGLYELTKGKPGTGASCERDPEMVPVWILVVSSADFERANGAWRQQTTEFAELERAGVSGPALSSIRHGLLATLAESVGAR